jgi:hypothetical protein
MVRRMLEVSMYRWAVWVGSFLVSTVLPAVAQDAAPGWRPGGYGMTCPLNLLV